MRYATLTLLMLRVSCGGIWIHTHNPQATTPKIKFLFRHKSQATPGVTTDDGAGPNILCRKCKCARAAARQYRPRVVLVIPEVEVPVPWP